MHISASPAVDGAIARTAQLGLGGQRVGLSAPGSVDLQGRVIARWLDAGVENLPASVSDRLERARQKALVVRFGSKSRQGIGVEQSTAVMPPPGDHALEARTLDARR
jgi:hypothetical protein